MVAEDCAHYFILDAEPQGGFFFGRCTKCLVVGRWPAHVDTHWNTWWTTKEQSVPLAQIQGDKELEDE